MPIAIYVLAVAAFAVGTAEFIISGILPTLAGDLGVSIPVAGLLVTAYASGVAVGGPALSIFTARFSQRAALIGIMLLFTLAQGLCAVAPDYFTLLLARLVAAASHGVFFGAGNVVLVALVPREKQGSAFSLFVGGITVANLLGLPAGTAIAQFGGWRMSFLAVGVLGIIATLALIFKLPPARADAPPRAAFATELRELRHHEVWLSYITIALVMTGALAFATYQVPILLTVTRLDPGLIPLYLLLGGVGSTFGIWLGGRGTDWKAMPFLLGVLAAQAVSYALMLLTAPHAAAMTVNLLVTSALGFAFSTPLQARVLHAAHKAPNFASALLSTAFNVGIASGAGIGALLLSAGVGYALLPGVSALSSTLAFGVALLSWRLDRRR